MKMKMLLPLALILVTLPGVYHPPRYKEIHIMAGELVVLHCPRPEWFDADESKLVWTGHTAQGSHVISDLSPAELMQRNMLLDGRSLVILRASVNHQGNYSCLLRNTSSQSWFKLTVHTVKSKEYEKWNTYPKTCDSQQSCRLHCPPVNVPPTITRVDLTWLKEGEKADSYFPSVEEKNSGDYICTWSFLYLNQTYNVTFTVGLKVTPKKPGKTSYITSPRNPYELDVTKGEQKVIECKAELYSELDRVLWYSRESIVDKDNSSRVFYNITKEKHGDE